MAGRALRSASAPVVLSLLIALLACSRAYADAGVVLNESLDESMDRITGSGHSAVYFSRICPESPVKLRLCRPDESGSVMSNYINIGEDHSYEWNVVPLNIYLYGVEDPRNRPIFGSYMIKHLLEERYRKEYLAAYCSVPACRTSPKSEWREMVAATLIRSVYIFAVNTTVEQDQALIAEFNAAANENHFNGVTRNCADFTRRVINTYFPHAVNADYLNDFGMTSPKAMARKFTRYALRHPESNFRVLHFAQVPGTIKRSNEVHAGTEQLYHSKKFLVPMLIFAPHELAVVSASYVLTGRFNPEHEFEKYPAAEPDSEISSANPDQRAASSPEEKEQIVGTSADWMEYRKAFNSLVDESQDAVNRRDFSRFFKHLDQEGTAFVDTDGSAWMELSEDGEPFRVGVSASNALAQGSDPRLAYKLILVRTRHVLKDPKYSRESMLEFQHDWALLQRASVMAETISASNAAPLKIAGTRLMRGNGKD